MRGAPAAEGLVRSPSAVSRRAVLRGTAAGAVAIAASPTLLAAPAIAAPKGPFVADDPDLHLLRRATFGPDRYSVNRIDKIGRKKWLDEQLDPDSIDDSELRRMLDRRFPGLAWTIPQAKNRLPAFSWDLMFDLGVAALARACWSRRQLFEQMVDFWSNHLNVTNPFDSGWDCRHDYDRKVIRAHALGRFQDMLIASAKHPAMLYYLNNAESSKYSPNENYGRELLELHSVGVDGGYDEDDMRNSALVMTGFTVDWETTTFVYEPSWHHTGAVRVMGWHAQNGSASKGKDVAIDYLKYLANHPSTAERIAFKLAQRFVSDEPPRGLVNKLADVYLDNRTAIVPVLRTLFLSSAFADSVGEKVKRPMEDIVSTVRILGMGPDESGTDGMTSMYWIVEGLADAPLAWVPPNGYPEYADAWRSAGGTLGRWNRHVSLAAHWWPKDLTQPNLRRYLLGKSLPATYGGLVDRLAQALVFRKLPAAHRSAILGFLEHGAGDALRDTDAAVNWRFGYLISLILDSPSFTTK